MRKHFLTNISGMHFKRYVKKQSETDHTLK